MKRLYSILRVTIVREKAETPTQTLCLHCQTSEEEPWGSVWVRCSEQYTAHGRQALSGNTISVSIGCWNRRLRAGWLTSAEMYSLYILYILEDRRSKLLSPWDKTVLVRLYSL